ncbi:16S rRNA (uracil(1498)-N(3))-methyltransferase [Flavobacterium sp. CS20]|uniref:16S rRNA (uracil(1498)-N(3))-methyltransferase n=1 Tax=Flavobacterium sp. CS20 TaxID=2775246 RepID=UPI001B3A472D|nr:16S rRNA (uracil(1498)-N(3))-methyltransferase [Flavobacterium sp. CS20]QTY27759.1 16S rRNA (uracil(1498)-N(3))-methyltransferase [Flavobacterium sp. CS20]
MFYEPSITPHQNTHTLNPNESKHILRVLRKQVGDSIKITNGLGDAFEAKIIAVKSKQCQINIISHFYEKPLPYQLHIGIAPPKSADRFEFFLEKATELGISEISPLICKNSERKRLNFSRCEKIIQSAMKQSLRLYMPKLNPIISFEEFVKIKFDNYTKLIAHCENDKKHPIRDKINQADKFCVLIGPEGDFSLSEIETAINLNFSPISLGNKRLRTETVAITVCQALALLKY